MNIILKLTTGCNNECSYCYMRDASNLPMISTSDFKDIIDRLPVSEPVNIVYHGGEPLLIGNSTFLQYQQILLTSKLNVTQSIQTNGLLLDDEWVSTLIKNNISCSTTLDFSTERKLQITTERIRECVSQGLNLGVIVVIHKHNIKRLREMYDTLREVGVTNISYNLVYESQELEVNTDLYLNEYIKFYNYLVRTKDICERTFLNHYCNYIGMESNLVCNPTTCRYNWVTVEPDMTMYPCDRKSTKPYKLGKIHDYSNLLHVFATDTYSKYYKDTLLLQHTHCVTCEVRDFCKTSCFCHHSISKNTMNKVECDLMKSTFSILDTIFKRGSDLK